MPRQNKNVKPQRIKKEKFQQEVFSEDTQQRITVVAKTANQKAYINAINNNDMVFGLGPAGVGKSWIAVSLACKHYLEGKVNKIYIVRPNESSGPSLGFIKGELAVKLSYWNLPIIKIFEEVLGKAVTDLAILNGNIEFCVFENMRGVTFKDCFLILDESQNVSLSALKMFCTRLGENAKIVVNGDCSQTDIHNSGLEHLIKIVKRANIPTPIIQFTMDDCVRSGLAKAFLIAFEDYKIAAANDRLHVLEAKYAD